MDPHNQSSASHPQGSRAQNAVYDTTHGGHYGTYAADMHQNSNAAKWPCLDSLLYNIANNLSFQAPVQQ